MICNRCKNVFDDDEMVVEYDDPSPTGVALPAGYYTYCSCPYCGSDDIEESHFECSRCGKNEQGVIDGEYGFCDECLQEIETLTQEVEEKLGLTHEEFTEAMKYIF